MMYHVIEGGIDPEMQDKILAILNDPNFKEHTIFLSSTGGNVIVADTITRIINEFNKREGCTAIVVFHYLVFSACFNIMFELNPKNVRYADNTELEGMIHFISNSIRINQKGNPLDEGDAQCKKSIEESLDSYLEMFKRIGLHKKEIASFMDGKDTYLSATRMKQLCKKNKIKPYGE